MVLLPEPPTVEHAFRDAASSGEASPKLRADASVAAFADLADAEVIAFDQALAGRCIRSRLLIS